LISIYKKIFNKYIQYFYEKKNILIQATDADAEPPNNEIRYELIHGNYENKFYLNKITGELTLLSPVTKFRRKKQSNYDNFSKKLHKKIQSVQPKHIIQETVKKTTVFLDTTNSTESVPNETELKQFGEIKGHRRKRAEADILYTLTARAYDLGKYSYSKCSSWASEINNKN